MKLSELTLHGLIRLLREIATLLVLGYLTIKLFTGELSIDFGKLSAVEMVSLLLAFFSIALSAAFYFAATSQSNQFYDNVNKFSKDTSELLGRVDEQIKGIGGRQSELKDSLDRYYLGNRVTTADAAKEEVQAKTKEVEANLSKLVSDLLDKSNLSADERTTFEQELRKRDAELSTLRERLGRMSATSEVGLRNYTRSKIQQIGIAKAIELTLEELLLQVARLGPSAYRRDLATYGYLTDAEPSSAEAVTEKGKQMVQAALERALEAPKEA